MKTGFYPKLAWNSIKKNKRLYRPYIFTCIGMVMMFYIVTFLKYSKIISEQKGGSNIQMIMGLGSFVMAVFSLIFLFYTNSFLVKRRKKEFGLYNILGMSKWNVGRIILWESLIVAVLSMLLGLGGGIIISKLAELLMINILNGDITYSLSVSLEAVKMTILIFCIIFVLIFFNTLRQIRFSNTIALLHSENLGEKPPKANWFCGILGVVLLAAAYYIAVTIKQPIAAMTWFFGAVILVIIGTYFLFIAGSVLFCRILQKKKKYYYKANHFVSVSSMVHRMKRNGAGLASICILATMVLVIISSTTSLYFGLDDSLNSRYPREICVNVYSNCAPDLINKHVPALSKEINSINSNYNCKPNNVLDVFSAEIDGFIKDGKFIPDTDRKILSGSLADYSDVVQLNFISLDEYNREMGTKETLMNNEVLMYSDKTDLDDKTITIENGESFTIKKHLDSFINGQSTSTLAYPIVYVVVPDIQNSLIRIDKLNDCVDEKMISYHWEYDFDTRLDKDEQIKLRSEIDTIISEYSFVNVNNEEYHYIYYTNGREELRSEYYETYAAFFFLGIMLSTVFIFAAVLIIYYKQISEGYEDQARFDIMQKVGMTKKEIRKSINSQLLTVFFMPLIGAGMHLAFAFPMIRKLLLLFGLNNVKLFALTTIFSFAGFALLYTLVYKITSNAYFNIVSGAREES